MNRFDEPVKIPPKTSNNYKQKDVFETKETKKPKKIPKVQKPKVKNMSSEHRKKKGGGLKY